MLLPFLPCLLSPAVASHSPSLCAPSPSLCFGTHSHTRSLSPAAVCHSPLRFATAFSTLCALVLLLPAIHRPIVIRLFVPVCCVLRFARHPLHFCSRHYRTFVMSPAGGCLLYTILVCYCLLNRLCSIPAITLVLRILLPCAESCCCLPTHHPPRCLYGIDLLPPLAQLGNQRRKD